MRCGWNKYKKMENTIILPAEWYPQSAVQLTWPHVDTDWAPILDEVVPCFVAIAKEVIKREKLLIVCSDAEAVRAQLGGVDESRILFREMETNDTWARDHGGISLFDQGQPVIYDFVFNGWGMKFAANKDNLITRNLAAQHTFAADIPVINMQPFVLEGGSIESDGAGTLLTTVECLASVNRNEYLQKEELEAYLKEVFGVQRILWLENGYLAGDDTDSHVDTLARFCRVDTIAYVQCTDETDEHFEELQAMEQELQAFRQMNGEPYRLVPLPMADPVEWEEERLPATYANFLIMNGFFTLTFEPTSVPLLSGLKDPYAIGKRAPLETSVFSLKLSGYTTAVSISFPVRVTHMVSVCIYSDVGMRPVRYDTCWNSSESVSPSGISSSNIPSADDIVPIPFPGIPTATYSTAAPSWFIILPFRRCPSSFPSLFQGNAETARTVAVVMMISGLIVCVY